MTAVLKIGLLCGAFLLSFVVYGQENQAVPLGALPMQYNGSFAGETGSPRMNTVTSWSTNQLYGGYGRGSSVHAVYDQFFPAIRSGIGVTAGYRYYRQESLQLGNFYSVDRDRGTYVSLAFAPKFSMGGKVTLSPSLDVTFYGGQSAYKHTWENRNVRDNGVTSRVGLLLNTDRFYAGYSVHVVDHLNSYLQNDTTSLRTSGRREKFTSYWQFGYTFGRGTESKFSFTPQLVFTTGTARYSRRGYVLFSPADFNLNFRYKQAIWGANLTGWHIGWQTDKVRIMLSDNLEYLRQKAGYSANLAVRYIFKE